MSKLFLNELGIICSMGSDKNQVAEHLFSKTLPETLSLSDKYSVGRSAFIGSVNIELPNLTHLDKCWRSRNNQLIAVAAEQIKSTVDSLIKRYGAHRIAVVLGTSTSGVSESELAHDHKLVSSEWPDDFHYMQQETGSPALFLSHLLGIAGPSHVISTACSSSAKAMSSGARLINAGLADVVIVGGADSLCAFTLAGFGALESLSAERCNPFSANRKGINIGEGAALFIMSREPGPVQLVGWGESSDAHHMSAPEPSGAGAIDALMQTLKRANLQPNQIDYINLHGTATLQNDAMEARVVNTVFGSELPASSTKAMTGHTLGAAGAVEAGLCWLCLVQNPDNILPVHWWDGENDSRLPSIHLVKPGEKSVRPLQNII
ncbi:MAG: beta-ketoacyl-ACP synthase, partial [Arenimonas sp.]|nr:beta-ketoacyl-ACP synthase [Arenimonas sp.]